MITLCASFHLPTAKEGVTCKTAKNEEGKCVQITECESLANILGKPLGKENIKYFKKLGCGFDNQIPKICCPVQTFDITTKSEDASEASVSGIALCHNTEQCRYKKCLGLRN